MGLAAALGFGPNPFTNWTGSNQGLLTGLSAGLLSGDLTNLAQTLPAGLQIDRQAADKLKADKLAESQANYTETLLKDKAPDLYAAYKGGAPIGAVWSEYLNRTGPQSGEAIDPTASVEGRTQLASQYGLNPDETKLFVLTGKLPGGNDTPRYGNAPIYARGPNGDYIAIQPGSDGSLNNLSSQLPPGYKIDPGALNSDKAAGTAWGTAQGGAQFNLPAAKQNIDLEIANIDAILSDNAGLSQTFGNAVQAGPIGIPNQWLPTLPNTPKANLQERVKQVVGQNFLQAFASLKGAGAITETEGSKAQEAMARLGSAQDRASFEQALRDLKDVLKIGYDRMSSQAASGPYQSGGFVPPALGGSNVTSTGIPWSVTP